MIVRGDCLQVMGAMAPSSVDAIVTDPPYGLGFMGKAWDHGVPGVEFWWAALDVAKPGAHLLAFGGTRTYHRLACAIEDAGWEVRDCLSWLYGSGFPKSLDVSKAIDRRPLVARHAEFAAAMVAARAEAGLSRADVSERVVGSRSGACWNWEHHQFPEARHWPFLASALPTLDSSWGAVLAEAEREATGVYAGDMGGLGGQRLGMPNGARHDTPATPAAREWSGWGTALKPAWEPVIVARKPLAGTVAANVLEWGTGALNVDGCRVGLPPGDPGWNVPNADTRVVRPACSPSATGIPSNVRHPTMRSTPAAGGRWPANVALDEVAAGMLDEQVGQKVHGAGEARSGSNRPRMVLHDASSYSISSNTGEMHRFGDTGGPSRFFYCAKASKKDRTSNGRVENRHPTVKPNALMRWLVRLVTPPGGLVLDPFAGSGSTAVACADEGFKHIGIERDQDSAATAGQREACAIQDNAGLFA